MSTQNYLESKFKDNVELEPIRNVAKSTRKYAAKEIPSGCYLCGSETLRQRKSKLRVQTFDGHDNVFHISTYRLCVSCSGYDGKINPERFAELAVKTGTINL